MFSPMGSLHGTREVCIQVCIFDFKRKQTDFLLRKKEGGRERWEEKCG